MNIYWVANKMFFQSMCLMSPLLLLTEQPLQTSDHRVPTEVPHRCGQTDLRPIQKQPQGFHWLP